MESSGQLDQMDVQGSEQLIYPQLESIFSSLFSQQITVFLLSSNVFIYTKVFFPLNSSLTTTLFCWLVF